ncbi:hypothetical protein CFC21_033214 [Triticum aestivum]|uniref:DUF4220 domain-containing protein n=3 Tax=Triticum TaxID=4564 RepID=A0A9R1JJT3_WHEAT|nr:uncharacterized protein LOC119266572 isoform X1 [Triticum dicoccoides]XP_044338158.1 uncharacterized protein LOC123059739 [Triticum aestivum]KAF7020095.1 hypothetical protein CFC21_033214 [Triticum aestivum]
MGHHQTLMEGEDTCPYDAFYASKEAETWRSNALLTVDAILVVIMVGIGAYGHHYRHRPFTRFLYDGATSLFLPIMSYVVSGIGGTYMTAFTNAHSAILVGECQAAFTTRLVIGWACLVQIVAINISVVVAGDEREGRNTGPSVVLLVQAMWTCYLAIYYAGLDIDTFGFVFKTFAARMSSLLGFLYLGTFVIIFAKMTFKFHAFYKVRRSIALGLNPRLVVGYMEQLNNRSQPSERAPPPLLVMGEETSRVKKQPRGYCFVRMSEEARTNNMLVTIDKIWLLEDMLLGSSTRLKDVCLSFTLFKLLRCRFARYTIAEAGFHKVNNFFWRVLLKDGDDERVFRVIADELSFLYDYYYSSLSISYPSRRMSILSIIISLLSIGGCLSLMFALRGYWSYASQFVCEVNCPATHDKLEYLGFGNYYIDHVLVHLLAALVVLTEARDIASYICSNWTKVALICGYVKHASWQQSRAWRGCVSRVLQCRCKLFKIWEDKMNQCSILMLRPAKTPLAFLGRLINTPQRKKKIPRAVKASIINALRSYEESRRTNGMASMPRSLQVGEELCWMFDDEGTCDTMLVCHIATSILEVRSHQHQPFSNHRITATHLSRYCAYLVAYSPELLPDDDAWCKSLYEAVKKDADRALAGGIRASTPEAEYHQLVELLSTRPMHEVLQKGVELGKRLAGMIEREDTIWEVLAGFWSEMILYVAPSENINGHAEAIARGGELITLLWALLAHVGIVGRSHNAPVSASDVV